MTRALSILSPLRGVSGRTRVARGRLLVLGPSTRHDDAHGVRYDDLLLGEAARDSVEHGIHGRPFLPVMTHGETDLEVHRRITEAGEQDRRSRLLRDQPFRADDLADHLFHAVGI